MLVGEIEDAQLVARAARGDDLAFELLLRRHADAAWKLARSLLQDDFSAEEAVQDAFVKAHGSLGGFRGDSSFLTWLLAICRHTCLDRLRARRPDTVPLDGAPQLRSVTYSYDDRLAIEQALAALPPDEREAFTLVHVLGYSREEAAAVTGAPASTIRSRVSRARTRLAEALTDEPADEPGRGGTC